MTLGMAGGGIGLSIAVALSMGSDVGSLKWSNISENSTYSSHCSTV